MDAYAQLIAEGYLARAPGSRHVRGRGAGRGARPRRGRRRASSAAFDFFPGYPGPRLLPPPGLAEGAARDAARRPRRAFGYPDPRGAPELRRALARVTCGGSAAWWPTPSRSWSAPARLRLSRCSRERSAGARDRGRGSLACPRTARSSRPTVPSSRPLAVDEHGAQGRGSRTRSPAAPARSRS